ncbi:NRAMP family divalent metal transporter [Anaerotruncus rubiinfantis]|uniref:NRAMP family divalent metal transporter n=1 Tax=Anaerotruncus rubiinfantis TaxID=1720200 RepID=UPI0011C71910|nr:divalent metal cation transporter [Anaerotruncus rubiinfantis]
MNNPQGTEKKSFVAILGAAFLAATTQIGPGFTTQTAMFTAQLGGAFFIVILGVLILDLLTQGNVYRIICFTGMRAQEIAGAIHKSLGWLLAFLVLFGIFAFQLGNVSGTGLGLSALFGLNTTAATIVSGLLAIILFLSKSANKIISVFAQICGGVILVACVYIAFASKPPVNLIFSEFAAIDKSLLIFPALTILGGSAGGYAPLIGSHRLIDQGLSGEADYCQYKRTQFTAAAVAYTVRILLFLCTFGVVAAGATLDMNNPAPSAFQAAAGMFGYRLFGLVMFAAGITTVVGGAVTFCTIAKTYSKFVAKHERVVSILFVVICTVMMVFIGQPAAMLVAAGAFNVLIMPFMLIIMLVASRNKKLMGENYTHPWFLTVGGIICILISGYFGAIKFPAIFTLFA